MTKKRAIEDSMGNSSDNDSQQMSEAESEVNVEFEFFDPQEKDFHSIRMFLLQLFGQDKVDVSDLANLIISQPLLGTTIKSEGEDDLYNIFTVLNMNVHKNSICIQQIQAYILAAAQSNPPFYNILTDLLAPSSQRQVGLLISERLINMPIQVVPPMYRMLAEEIQWAIEDGEPYDFEYYLLLSKTYKEVKPQETAEGNQMEQATKKTRGQHNTELQFTNQEDSIIAQFADYEQDLPYQANAVPDAKRAFSDYGVLPGRKAFFIHKSKYEPLLKALSDAITLP